jgi:hypothetical protein
MHPVMPDLPERKVSSPQHSLAPSAPTHEVSTQSVSQPAKIDTNSLTVGETIIFQGQTFRWDGFRFQNAEIESMARAQFIKRLVIVLTLGLIGILIAWLVMSGLDWEAMTLDERAPYKTAGRIAVLIYIPLIVALFRAFPSDQTRNLDRTIRDHHGIAQRGEWEPPSLARQSCRSCGKRNPSTAKDCIKCGKTLN